MISDLSVTFRHCSLIMNQCDQYRKKVIKPSAKVKTPLDREIWLCSSFKCLLQDKFEYAMSSCFTQFLYWVQWMLHSHHFRHVIQGASLLLIELALNGRHPLQLLLRVAVARDSLLSFHSLLENTETQGNFRCNYEILRKNYVSIKVESSFDLCGSTNNKTTFDFVGTGQLNWTQN